jgi:hypothetical protein
MSIAALSLRSCALSLTIKLAQKMSDKTIYRLFFCYQASEFCNSHDFYIVYFYLNFMPA